MQQSTRIEKDSLGEMQVPEGVYYGIQTLRAVKNFPISGIRSDPAMIHAIGSVKLAAAAANVELGVLPADIGGAISEAAREVFEGKWDDQFVVDAFQAGAGTSFNMNANEVIANRALEILGREKGDYRTIHPNDHVNMAQSTNDVFPTAMRISLLCLLSERLLPGLLELESALAEKGKEFSGIIKSGRTHLQDAVPIRLGQEFAAYAESVRRASAAIDAAGRELERMNIGGTAIGTGLNAHPRYRSLVVANLRRITQLPVNDSGYLIEMTESTADFARFSSAVKNCALELTRIANDLRLLSSGPKTGLGEIVLPPVQPGSSIMPGKVNPSIPEMVNMVCCQVVGNDLAVTLATQAGQLELNVMTPLIAHSLTQSVRIIGNAAAVLASRCVSGIVANSAVCEQYAEGSQALVTVLAPRIGYLASAEVVKESHISGRSIREIVLEKGLLSREELERLLDPMSMTRPEGSDDVQTADPEALRQAEPVPEGGA